MVPGRETLPQLAGERYEAFCIDRWSCYLLMGNLITHRLHVRLISPPNGPGRLQGPGAGLNWRRRSLNLYETVEKRPTRGSFVTVSARRVPKQQEQDYTLSSPIELKLGGGVPGARADQN